MGRKTYQLVTATSAADVCLGTIVGFGKDEGLYEDLENQMRRDWNSRNRSVLEQNYNKYDHVLVNSPEYNGCKRGIIVDFYKCQPAGSSGCTFSYVVFLYDEGVIQTVDRTVITYLTEERKQVLSPRTLRVLIPGVVPLRRVKDLSKILLRMNSVIYTQDSEWLIKATTQVREWLQDKNIEYLIVDTFKTNMDGSVYGSIHRRINNSFESLEAMLISENLALENEELRQKQLQVAKVVDFTTEIFQDLRDALGTTDNNKKDKPEVERPSTTSAIFSQAEAQVEPTLPDFTAGGANRLDDDEGASDSTYMEYPANKLETSWTNANFAYNTPDIPGRLLVRGTYVRPPYNSIADFRLPPKISQALTGIGASELSELQKVVASNFIRGSDLIVISADGGTQAEKSARLLSYILPVIKLIYENTVETKECSPELIIVCHSYTTGVNLESTIHSLLSLSQHLPLRVKFVGKSDETQNPKLPRGVSILILTISSLSGILETRIGSHLFSRLKFIVFEEVELYLRKFWDQLMSFIQAARANLQISQDSLPFQITLAGSRWTEEIEDLYRCLVEDRAPVVFISAVNQVIRYAKIQWIVHHVESETNRMSKLIELIKNCCTNHKRIVVACSTPIVVNAVNLSLLNESGICSMAVTSELVGRDLKSIVHEWKSESGVLIISDEMIRGIDVTNATCLICYDSPQLQEIRGVKRSVAAERFGYMWSNIRCIESDSKLQKSSSDATNLVSHFLLTGEENNFYALYKFAKSLGDIVQFPENLKTLALKLEKLGTIKVPLCEGIKLFGFCNYAEPACCTARHFFTEDEFRTFSAPLMGEVELRIIKCENPSQYRARLLRHFSFTNGKRICERSYINELVRRHKLMGVYYAEEGNRRKPPSWKEGTMCAVYDPEATSYTRGQIIRILTKDSFDYPKAVRVTCIDTGLTLNPSTEAVYGLDSEFERWTPLVVEVILGNLKPIMSELEFRPIQQKKAKEIAQDKIYNAKIWLSIGNTIWVNPMVEYHLDHDTGSSFRGISVRVEFINDKIADCNVLHLSHLIDLVKEHGDLYPESKNLDLLYPKVPIQDELTLLKQEFHYLEDEYTWAFVESSKGKTFDPAKIATRFGWDPWSFFGVHVKYEEQLAKLEKELHAYVEGSISDRYPKHEAVFANFYELDMIVAAKEKISQTWMRAIILSKYNSKDGQPMFEIFFVDYGDHAWDMTAQELFPIPHTFVNRLPLQAIAFKLNHIQPPSGLSEWEQSEKDAFLDLILPNSLSIVLELAVTEKIDNSDLPVQCRYYNAMAVSDVDEIGHQLVKQSKAKFKDGADEIIVNFKDQLLQFYETTVSSALHLDLDEDETPPESDDDTYEVNLGNMDPKAFLEEALDLKVDSSYNSDERQVVQLQNSIMSPDLSLKDDDIVKGLEQPDSEPRGHTVDKTRQSCPQNSSAFSGILHPQVLWRQTNDCVILSVQLPDIQDYSVKIGSDKQTVSFKTTKPENYGFNVRLYGKLLPDYQEQLTGQCLKLTFKKRMSGVKWIRVLYDKKEKFRWLKDDLNFLESPEQDAEEMQQKSKIKKLINDLHLYDEEDDDSLSDDEAERSKLWSDEDNSDDE